MPPTYLPKGGRVPHDEDISKSKRRQSISQNKQSEKERLSKHDKAVIIRKHGKLKRMHFVNIQWAKAEHKPNIVPTKKKKTKTLKPQKVKKKLNLIGYFPKKRVQWIGFFVLLLLLIVNSIYMTLRFMDNKYEYNIFNYANIEAVLPNQDITGPVRTGVVLIREIDLSKLQPDDYVVVCCDFNLEDTNWVERVVAVDLENKTIRTSYDEIFQITVTLDQTYGVYVRNSGPIGTLYYSATFLRGYLLLNLGQIIILYGYFYVVIKKRKDTLFRDR